MTQIPSHSQTPQFGHTPQTGILYQQPPSTQQIAKANRWNKFKAFTRNAIAVVVFSSPILATTFAIHSCSDDVDRQTVQAVKFQAQVGGSYEK
jgi:hypothetical protein